MSDIGNLKIGDIKKKKEDLNKAGGINTEKSVFDTGGGVNNDYNPYAGSMGMQQPYMSRVNDMINRGPLMQTRIHTQNSNDIAFPKRVEKERTSGKQAEEKEVRSEERHDVIKARPELKVFNEEVIKNGAFTPQAKEAARHFFRQISQWAGSFNDGGSGFYGSMGISSVIDCLYVDGMSLRNYLKEQYYYKVTGNPAQDEEAMRNYVALIAARGEHVITLVRPEVKGDEAEVSYKNLHVDLSEVGEDADRKSDELKERGNQIRSNLKKRLDREMTERTGRAYRKAYGCESNGFKRIEEAKDGLSGAEGETSDEYRVFNEKFGKYNGGLQKLGLKPGREDINLAVAEKLKARCEEALKAADEFLQSGSRDEQAVKAVKNAKAALETDLKLLTDSINTKLAEEGARMKLEDLLNAGEPEGDKGGSDKGGNDEGTGEDGGEPESSGGDEQ